MKGKAGMLEDDSLIRDEKINIIMNSYNQFRDEIYDYLVRVKDYINRDEFVSKKYFKTLFLIKMLGALEVNKENCNCHSHYLNLNDFEMHLKGIVLSSYHRDDWQEAIDDIFSDRFIKKLKKEL